MWICQISCNSFSFNTRCDYVIPSEDRNYYKTRIKNYDVDVKIKVCRKRIHASQYVKYLGVFTDENLNWKTNTNEILTKLIKDNTLLSELRHFVNKDILLSAHYATFHSHLAYISASFGVKLNIL